MTEPIAASADRPAGRVLLQHAAYATLGLTNKQVAVCDALWTICQGRPAVIFAHYAQVAELARCDCSTARKAIKVLAKARVLRVLPEPRRGGALVQVHGPEKALGALRARLHAADPQLELEFAKSPLMGSAASAPPSDVAASRSADGPQVFFDSEVGRPPAPRPPAARRRPASPRESMCDERPNPADADLADLGMSSTVLAIAAAAQPASDQQRHARCDVHQTSITSLHQTSESCAKRTSTSERAESRIRPRSRDRPPPHEHYSDLEPLWGLADYDPRVKAYALELLDEIRRSGDSRMLPWPCMRVAIACTNVLNFREEIERSFRVARRRKPADVPLGRYLIAAWKRRFQELGLKW